MPTREGPDLRREEVRSLLFFGFGSVGPDLQALLGVFDGRDASLESRRPAFQPFFESTHRLGPDRRRLRRSSFSRRRRCRRRRLVPVAGAHVLLAFEIESDLQVEFDVPHMGDEVDDSADEFECLDGVEVRPREQRIRRILTRVEEDTLRRVGQSGSRIRRYWTCSLAGPVPKLPASSKFKSR